MNLFLLSAYFVFFCTAMQYTSCFDFSLKGISSWITGNTEKVFLKEAYFDFDGTVVLENGVGSVIVKSWSLPKIAIEAIKKAPEKEIDTVIINTQMSNNKVSINSTIKNTAKNNNHSIDYRLIVPYKTNLIIKNKGTIKIKNIEGNIKASSESTIDIRGAVGNVTVQSNGTAMIAFSTLPLESLVHITSTKSNVVIALPSQINATLTAKTEFNMINSEHFIMLNPMTILLNKQTWNRLQKEVYGMIGNGGTQIVLTAYNGVTITY